ncbi:MAG: hypothetical protein ACRBFS_22845 [Aureispira sp.]
MSIFTDHIEPAEKQQAGVADTLWVGLVEDMTTIGAVDPAATTIAGKLTITTAHAFTTGEGFIKVGLLPNTGLMTDSAEGELGSEVNTPTFTGIARESKELKYMIESGKKMILLWRPAQCTDSEYRQLGDECNPASMRANFSSGSAGGSGDRRGYSITATAPNESKYYDAAVDLIGA